MRSLLDCLPTGSYPETGFEEVGRLVLGKASKEDRTISDGRGSQPHRGQDSKLGSEIQACQSSKRLSVTASR